ncbi:MAG: hypothetical protein KTR28_07330 [Micavibrio sp.]|nr:hypothetical protein [Micavibrio sp.]
MLVEGLENASVPDKFKNPENGAVRLDALAKSYAELERKMSGQPKAPHSADEYCINCDHGLFKADPEINARLHARGMTQDQVQEVYDIAAEKMVPMVKDLSHDMKAERELERLVAHFGGEERWREISRQLLSFGQKNLPADVLDNLSSSYEGILALHRMMKSGEPGLKKASGQKPGAIGADDLQSMMRDPRYWKERDPSYVSKVTEGFKNVYGK